MTKKTRKLDYNPARFEKAGRAAERAAERISGELDNLLDGLHPDVSASYALTRLVQRLIELQPLLLDMIVTHGLVDLGELVASLPLNALVERRKLAMLRWLCRRNRRPAKPVAMICTARRVRPLTGKGCRSLSALHTAG